MTRAEREGLRLAIDAAKRERLARASWTSGGGRDRERRRASQRAYYQRQKELSR